MIKFNLAALILVLFCVACNNNPTHTYSYIPLTNYTLDTLLPEGTAVKIIGMSGSGRANDDVNIYYHQMIAINTINGDTLNVLSPVFYANDDTNRELFSPVEFDYNSKMWEAKYEKLTAQTRMTIHVFDKLKYQSDAEVESIDVSEAEINKRVGFVALNNSIPDFKNNYKTVVGVLVFNQDPRRK